MSELAIQGCQVSITSGQTASAINITTQPSSDVFVNNKGVYFGDINVSLTAVTSGSYVCASATITISGTAGNILNSNGDKAVVKGDSGSKSLTFTNPSTSEQITATVRIEVTNAGQTDVIAL